MSLIRKPFELEINPFVKVLIYGQPGLGKTTLALSTPQPLLFDFDRGTHRIDPRHQVPTLQMTKWEDVDEVLNEDLTEYKTLVIDTAGKMLDFMNVYLMRTNPKLKMGDGSLTLQGYGARKALFINFIGRVSLLGKHLIFVAHEREEKDGETKIIRPEIGGSSAGDLIKELDLVGYMQAVGKQRTISFDPCEKFYAKNTCKLQSLIGIPDLSVNGAKNDFMTNIFNLYAENSKHRGELGIQYKRLMDSLVEAIEKVVDAETANSFMEQVKSVSVIWDSKIQASMRLRDKAHELGLKLDKEAGKYVQGEKKPEPVKQAEPQAEAKTFAPPKTKKGDMPPATKQQKPVVENVPPEGDIQAKIPELNKEVKFDPTFTVPTLFS